MKANPILRKIADEFYIDYLKCLKSATSNSQEIRIKILLGETIGKIWNQCFNSSSSIPKVVISKPQESKNIYGCYSKGIIKVSYELINEKLKDRNWSYRVIDCLAHELAHYKNDGKPCEFNKFDGHNEWFMLDAHRLGLKLNGTFQKFKGSEELYKYILQGWNPERMSFYAWLYEQMSLGWNEEYISLDDWCKFRKAIEAIKSPVFLLVYFDLFKKIKAKFPSKERWLEVFEKMKQLNPSVAWFEVIDDGSEEWKAITRRLRNGISNLRKGKITYSEVIDESKSYLPESAVRNILTLENSISRQYIRIRKSWRNFAKNGEDFVPASKRNPLDEYECSSEDMYSPIYLLRLYEDFFNYLGLEELSPI